MGLKMMNTLEQIAEEEVGQNTLNNLVQISENVQSNSSNVFSAFLTNSLNCVVDLRPP